jgi:hypothetical protein
MSRHGFRALEISSLASIVKPDPLPAARSGTTLEKDYPRVVQAIAAMWGFKELNLYFRKLAIDDHGEREGFRPEIWDDIHTLRYLHEELAPDVVTESSYYK